MAALAEGGVAGRRVIHPPRAAIHLHRGDPQAESMRPWEDPLLKAVGMAVGVVHGQHHRVHLDPLQQEQRFRRVVVRGKANEARPALPLRLPPPREDPIGGQKPFRVEAADTVRVEEIDVIGLKIGEALRVDRERLLGGGGVALGRHEDLVAAPGQHLP